jgi:hypothetical protein
VKAGLLIEQAVDSSGVLGLFAEKSTVAADLKSLACLFLRGLFGCFGMGAVELSTEFEVILDLGVLVRLVDEVVVVVVVVVGVVGVVVVVVEVVVVLFVLF